MVSKVGFGTKMNIKNTKFETLKEKLKTNSQWKEISKLLENCCKELQNLYLRFDYLLLNKFFGE